MHGIPADFLLAIDDPPRPVAHIVHDALVDRIALSRSRTAGLQDTRHVRAEFSRAVDISARLQRRRIASVGGHVAGSLATRFDARVYAARNEADQFSARPDSVKLMYPVITMKEGAAQAGSRASLLSEAPAQALVDKCSLETASPANTPATLIIHAADDASVPVNNALMMFSALRAAAVPASLDIFDSGGHGFSLPGIENDPR